MCGCPACCWPLAFHDRQATAFSRAMPISTTRPACGCGVVAGALDVGGAQRVGLVGVVLEFGLDGEGGFGGERGEGAEEQLPDPLVESGAGDGLADPAGVGDAVTLAHIGGDLLVAALVVADGHALPAGPADDDALQQRGAFAGRPGGPVPAVRGGV